MMQPDVYRKMPPRAEAVAARRRALGEELLIPLLALMLGGLMLFVSLGDGNPRPTEGGLGTVAILFGLYALREAVQAVRKPRHGHVDDAG